jgi:hypothetical protein
VLGTDDGAKVPQIWCLYKEVEGYYDGGMTVPDDVTLLWTDDKYVPPIMPYLVTID